jgi:flagellar hook-associated protein 1
MSGLFSTLDSSVKALNAQSAGIQTAGKNLANVNNPNYARQRVIFGDGATVVTSNGAQSLGIEVVGVEQIRDPLLDQEVAREISLSNSYQSQQQFLQTAQAGLGQNINNATSTSSTGSSAGTGGLGAAVDDFFNAFQSLAAQPTDTGERQTLIQKANILADTLQNTDATLAQVQSDINTRIQNGVSDANQQLQTIADLNKQIGSAEIGHPGSAVDLRDQRQAAIEQLSADVPVQTIEGTNGMVQVVMKDPSNANVVLVNGTSVTGPLAFSGSTLTGGASATTLQISSGSIYGALAASSGPIQDLRTSLDNIASQLVTSVNAIYGASGANFFDPAGTTAGTIAVASGVTAANLAAGTGAAGDNTIALGIAGVANTIFSTASGDPFDGTVSQYYASAVSNLGQSLSSVNQLVDNQSSVESLVRTQRDNLSGVSTDEEMADLMKFQNAYQASAKVFSIVNDLLGTVINNLGTSV